MSEKPVTPSLLMTSEDRATHLTAQDFRDAAECSDAYGAQFLLAAAAQREALDVRREACDLAANDLERAAATMGDLRAEKDRALTQLAHWIGKFHDVVATQDAAILDGIEQFAEALVSRTDEEQNGCIYYHTLEEELTKVRAKFRSART